MRETILISVVVMLITTLYIILGIGTARLIGYWKSRDISLGEIMLWPLVLIVMASIGDVE